MSTDREARERRMAQIPGISAQAVDAKQYAAYAIANETTRGRHSQACPVWTRHAATNDCQCWILADAISAVENVLAAMDRYRALAAPVADNPKET